jgi:ADP-heptose:LPS heptosyltransferase
MRLIRKILLGILRISLPCFRVRNYSAAIVKLDSIGDFILSISAIRCILDYYGHNQCCLIINEQVLPIAEKEFPQATFIITDFLVKRGIGNLLKTFLVYQWKIRKISAQNVIALRHFRHDYDEAFLFLLKRKRSICIIPTNHVRTTHPLFTFTHEIVFKSSTSLDKQALSQETLLCDDLKMHQKILSFISGKKIKAEHILPSFNIIKTKTEKTEEILLIAPFCSNPIRTYPIDLLVKVLVKLRNFLPTKVLFTGSKDQANSLKVLQKRVDERRITNSHIEYNLLLLDYIDLVSRAKFIISMESATAHIATALDKPMIAILGGGHYNQHAPWRKSKKQVWLTHSLPCFGCNWNCIHPKPYCISCIQPKEILDAFDLLFHQL